MGSTRWSIGWGGEGGGSGRWLAVRGCVEFSRDGRAEVMRGVGYDITYRKMSEELFRSVVEASASAMIVVDGAGRVVEVNSRSEGMFGYVREELLGRQVEDLVPASLRASHAALRDTYATDPEARQMGLGRELMALRKDGTEFPAEISLSPIRAMDQWLVLATVVDITERRRLERERAAQRNELAHLSRVAVLGELSGSLADELNQPLAAILSNAQAAQRMMETGQADGGELVDILQETVDEDRRASEVIRRLWSLFRNGDVAHEPIDLNEQVVEAVRLVESEPRHHGIGVRVELAKGLPRVAADRVQVQQVVINLLMNAMDALSGRGVEGGSGGQITVVTGREEDGLVFGEVRDNGPGIAEADLPRLFEPFFTTKAQGLGLGLHICQTIATWHGGRMRAWNGEAGGAVLRMSLRCANLT